jgi:hypothetical protein
MSDAGLYSSLYGRIRDLAELLDEVLLGLKLGTSKPSDPNRQRLGQLFLSIGNRRTRDLTSQLLSILLRTEGTDLNEQWSEIGQLLLQGSAPVPPTVITTLEEVAQTLEHERAGVLAKMRGPAF